MILVDSGPLIAAAIADDPDYRRCVDMFATSTCKASNC